MDDLDIGRTILLWVYCFGLAGIEIEIEGGNGWAERLPTWWYKRGRFGKFFGFVMGGRPLTGYHVFAFTIPMLLLHLPFVSGVEWTLSGELLVIGTYFALAVIWDYIWFVLNPAYTVARFKRGQRLVVRGALDLALPARLLHGDGVRRRVRGTCGLVGGKHGPARDPSVAARGLGGADRAHRACRAGLRPLVQAHAARGSG